MSSYRLSPLAEADLRRILAASEHDHGPKARRRYAALMIAAFRKLADTSNFVTTKDRSEILNALKSFHLRHVKLTGDDRVRHPRHVIYFRPRGRGLIEIVRILHDRMEPLHWIGHDA